MLKVRNTLKIYEYNGEKTDLPFKEMDVGSHWNQESLVHLRINDQDVVVSASDLIYAVNNARNINRYG